MFSHLLSTDVRPNEFTFSTAIRSASVRHQHGETAPCMYNKDRSQCEERNAHLKNKMFLSARNLNNAREECDIVEFHDCWF
jgi:hypothetical protein